MIFPSWVDPAHSGFGLSIANVRPAGAAAFSRFPTSLLFGVQPLDATTYLAVFAVLFAAVSFAAYLPARRASSIAPVEALRHE